MAKKCQLCNEPAVEPFDGKWHCWKHHVEVKRKYNKKYYIIQLIKSFLKYAVIVVVIISGLFIIWSYLSDSEPEPQIDASNGSSLECSEDKGLCYEAKLNRVRDGYTMDTKDGTSIRLALVALSPQPSDEGKIKAKEFLETLCPVGSSLIIDEDDSHIKGTSGFTISKVTCNGFNLNKFMIESEYGELETGFCSSEFRQESWASECD